MSRTYRHTKPKYVFDLIKEYNLNHAFRPLTLKKRLDLLVAGSPTPGSIYRGLRVEAALTARLVPVRYDRRFDAQTLKVTYKGMGFRLVEVDTQVDSLLPDGEKALVEDWVRRTLSIPELTFDRGRVDLGQNLYLVPTSGSDPEYGDVKMILVRDTTPPHDWLSGRQRWSLYRQLYQNSSLMHESGKHYPHHKWEDRSKPRLNLVPSPLDISNLTDSELDDMFGGY